MPRVSIRSLCATGNPCRGPNRSLRACISSALAAAAAAISGTRVTMALTFGFTRSICFRCSARASRADSFLVRISRAISTALMKHRDPALSAPIVPVAAAAAVQRLQRLAAGDSVIFAPPAPTSAEELCAGTAFTSSTSHRTP